MSKNPRGPSLATVWRSVERHSFCTLATSSSTIRQHVGGVLYAVVDRVLFVSTLSRSKKARNVGDTARLALCIPVRKYPVGPPFCVQFGANAEPVSMQDAQMVELLRAGRLKRITSHGELDDPDSCFLRLVPDRKVHTYGLGVSLRTLLRDPIRASRTVDLESA